MFDKTNEAFKVFLFTFVPQKVRWKLFMTHRRLVKMFTKTLLWSRNAFIHHTSLWRCCVSSQFWLSVPAWFSFQPFLVPVRLRPMYKRIIVVFRSLVFQCCLDYCFCFLEPCLFQLAPFQICRLVWTACFWIVPLAQSVRCCTWTFFLY